MADEIKTTGNDLNTNRINIIHNHKATQMSIKDIFDAEK